MSGLPCGFLNITTEVDKIRPVQSLHDFLKLLNVLVQVPE